MGLMNAGAATVCTRTCGMRRSAEATFASEVLCIISRADRGAPSAQGSQVAVHRFCSCLTVTDAEGHSVDEIAATMNLSASPWSRLVMWSATT